MRLTDLRRNQNIIIQLLLGEKRIEFTSEVLATEDGKILVSPYILKGEALELNIYQDAGVICNVFADEPRTSQRISWKNVQLTTVNKNGKKYYCLKTYAFSCVADPEDRRISDRTPVEVCGTVYDGGLEPSAEISIHDISTSGLAFLAPESYVPQNQQITIAFSDVIDDNQFDVRVDCAVVRVSSEKGYNIIGCKIVGDSRAYELYGFMKRITVNNSMVAYNSVHDEKITHIEVA